MTHPGGEHLCGFYADWRCDERNAAVHMVTRHHWLCARCTWSPAPASAVCGPRCGVVTKQASLQTSFSKPRSPVRRADAVPGPRTLAKPGPVSVRSTVRPAVVALALRAARSHARAEELQAAAIDVQVLIPAVALRRRPALSLRISSITTARIGFTGRWSTIARRAHH
jgi:hypothetical protein